MKITDFAILFLIIAISIVVMSDIQFREINDSAERKIEYDMRLDSAIDDSVKYLVELDSNRELVLNKESSIDKFYQSLYANFGILGNKKAQELLKMYVPVIAVTSKDGYYILYNRSYQKNGTTIITQNWTEKKPYTLEDEKYIYNFTLNDYIKIYCKSNGETQEGDFRDLRLIYTDSLLASNNFDELRRNTIIQTITDELNYYINRHNRIAEHYGITYNFALPFIDKEEWYRTIDDTSFIVFFQGYPYGTYTLGKYNRFSIAAARVKKSNCYYIEMGVDGLYYHKDNCDLLKTKNIPYYRKKECALEGAYACLKCRP